jgi:hypothetical protein
VYIDKALRRKARTERRFRVSDASRISLVYAAFFVRLVLRVALRVVRLRGTLAPFFRASERPMAIACLRLVTFLPLRPLLSVPRFRLRIALFTDFDAPLPYLAI